jgi:hypothetical protein
MVNVEMLIKEEFNNMILLARGYVMRGYMYLFRLSPQILLCIIPTVFMDIISTIRFVDEFSMLSMDYSSIEETYKEVFAGLLLATESPPVSLDVLLMYMESQYGVYIDPMELKLILETLCEHINVFNLWARSDFNSQDITAYLKANWFSDVSSSEGASSSGSLNDSLSDNDEEISPAPFSILFWLCMLLFGSSFLYLLRKIYNWSFSKKQVDPETLSDPFEIDFMPIDDSIYRLILIIFGSLFVLAALFFLLRVVFVVFNKLRKRK